MRQMLVKGINAQGVLPVSQSLHVGERELPSTSAIGFAQRPTAVQLIGHAGQFLNGPYVTELGVRAAFIELVEQHVHRRALMPRVHGHVISTMIWVWPAMFPIMAGPLQPLLLGIPVPRF